MSGEEITYDPFERGPHPVGVRTRELHDSSRDRTLPVEVWYPATDEYAGQDLDAATKDHYEIAPGVPGGSQDAVRDAEPEDGDHWGLVHSHGMAGNRRASTFLNTYLASHGYVVAAPDHIGNTTTDVMQLFTSGGRVDATEYIRETVADRPPDAELVIDALLAGGLGSRVRQEGVGMSGHSYGGWTTLQVTGVDERVLTALPLAPAGGRTAVDMGPAQAIIDALELPWDRAVPMEMIVADPDSVLPYDGMVDILERCGSLDRMLVIANADHFHFNDSTDAIHDVIAPLMGRGAKPMAELIPGADAHLVTQAASVAHFDKTLRAAPAAAEFLESGLEAAFHARQITVEVVTT